MKNAKLPQQIFHPFFILVILSSVINTLGKNRHQLFVAFVRKDLPTFSRSENLVCPWMRGARTFFSAVMFSFLTDMSVNRHVRWPVMLKNVL